MKAALAKRNSGHIQTLTEETPTETHDKVRSQTTATEMSQRLEHYKLNQTGIHCRAFVWYRLKRKCTAVCRGGWTPDYTLFDNLYFHQWIINMVLVFDLVFLFLKSFILVCYCLQSIYASLFFRILTSSALLLCHIFHRLTDSPRGPWWETVSGQIRTCLGHLLSTCPLQDLPLYILKRKADGWHGPKAVTEYPCDSLSPHKLGNNLKYNSIFSCTDHK